MSKQLTVSAAFSIFMMATYVLLGTDAARSPLGTSASSSLDSPVEVSAPEMPAASPLLPILR